MTLSQLRPSFRTRSHSQVLSGHEFEMNTPTLYTGNPFLLVALTLPIGSLSHFLGS